MSETSLTTNEKLQSCFRMFDKDGSGLVSAEELKTVLEAAGSTDFDQIIKEFDSNGDGEVSFDEFVGMMMKVR